MRLVVANSLDRCRKGEGADSFQCGAIGKDDGGSDCPEDGLSVRLLLLQEYALSFSHESMLLFLTFWMAMFLFDIF